MNNFLPPPRGMIQWMEKHSRYDRDDRPQNAPARAAEHWFRHDGVTPEQIADFRRSVTFGSE